MASRKEVLGSEARVQGYFGPPKYALFTYLEPFNMPWNTWTEKYVKHQPFGLCSKALDHYITYFWGSRYIYIYIHMLFILIYIYIYTNMCLLLGNDIGNMFFLGLQVHKCCLLWGLRYTNTASFGSLGHQGLYLGTWTLRVGLMPSSLRGGV